MKTIILKYRKRIISPELLSGGNSLNWQYTPSFDFLQSRQWYVNNCWLTMDDLLLEGKYTNGTTENPRKDRCLSIVTYDETKITFDEIAYDLENNINATYSTRVFNKEEAMQFLDDYTTCNKVDNWDGTFTYTLRDESELLWVTTPAYLIII